jgi:hypothetical protein
VRAGVRVKVTQWPGGRFLTVGEALVGREDRSRRSTYPPAGVDANVPNIARVYDAFLGGRFL